MAGIRLSVIRKRQWTIDHVALGPLSPHAFRLYNDDSVPGGGLAECLERCKTHESLLHERRKHTELACIVCEGGIRSESTHGEYTDDSACGDVVFGKVLYSLVS